MSVLFICTMCMQLSTEVRGLDPLGGVRGGCETLDVGAGYGTWVWNLALSKSCDWN